MSRLILLFLIAVSLTLAAEDATQEKQLVPANVLFELKTDRNSYLIGENALLHLTVKTSHGTATFDYGWDNRNTPRSMRYQVTVRDASGELVPDPFPHAYAAFGGWGGSSEISEDKVFQCSLPLNRFALITKSGEYEITVSHDGGWRATEERPFPQASIRLNFHEPTAEDTQRLVAEWAQVQWHGATMGKLSKPHPDWSSIRYPLYLQSLRQLVAQGNHDAVTGIGSIPTLAATDELIFLLRDDDDAIVNAAMRELTERLRGLIGLASGFSFDGHNARLARLSGIQQRISQLRPEIKRLARNLNTNYYAIYWLPWLLGREKALTDLEGIINLFEQDKADESATERELRENYLRKLRSMRTVFRRPNSISFDPPAVSVEHLRPGGLANRNFATRYDSLEKGLIRQQQRLTLWTPNTTVAVGDPVTCFFCWEQLEQGGEWATWSQQRLPTGVLVNGHDVTPAADAVLMGNEAIQRTPFRDFSYQPLTLRFKKAGTYTVAWCPNAKQPDAHSNVLKITVSSQSLAKEP